MSELSVVDGEPKSGQLQLGFRVLSALCLLELVGAIWNYHHRSLYLGTGPVWQQEHNQLLIYDKVLCHL